MLGRKTFTHEEIESAATSLATQLAAYKRLTESIDGNAAAREALEAFEPLFFNNLTLALDRRFVHRVRLVAGKDGNALNEVELITEALLDHGGVFRGNSVIKVKPGETVLELSPGDVIALREADFERLSAAFMATLQDKFGEPAQPTRRAPT